jgi:hypothetical protein
MKFTHVLKFNSVPEWREAYINYPLLKRLVLQANAAEAHEAYEGHPGARALCRMCAGAVCGVCSGVLWCDGSPHAPAALLATVACTRLAVEPRSTPRKPASSAA